VKPGSAHLALAASTFSDPQRDAPSEALPPHARARLGATDWRCLGKTDVVALSADGRTSAVFEHYASYCSCETRIGLYDTQSGKKLRTIPTDWAHDPTQLHFRDADRQLVSFSPNNIQIWDATTGRLVKDFKPERYGLPVAASADGGRFAFRYADRGGPEFVEVWDLDAQKKLVKLNSGGDLRGWLALSSDGTMLATIGYRYKSSEPRALEWYVPPLDRNLNRNDEQLDSLLRI
jgi:hypothetical protein